MSDCGRQTGRTSRQMMEAPPGATFVWNNSMLDYPRSLAADLGRTDLIIRPRSWLDPMRVRGLRGLTVVLDHAIELDQSGLKALDILILHHNKQIDRK